MSKSAEKPTDKSIQSIMDSFRRIVKILRTSSKDSEDESGLKVAQLFVLQQLKTYQPLSLNELAEHTYSHQSTVSVVVDGLAKKGLVSRSVSKSDQRRLVLELTPEGMALIKKKKLTVQERFIGTLEKFSSSERRQLATLLEQFMKVSGLDEMAPTFFFEEEPATPKKDKKSEKKTPIKALSKQPVERVEKR